MSLDFIVRRLDHDQMDEMQPNSPSVQLCVGRGAGLAALTKGTRNAASPVWGLVAGTGRLAGSLELHVPRGGLRRARSS
jgi:hypothetical protein